MRYRLLTAALLSCLAIQPAIAGGREPLPAAAPARTSFAEFFAAFRAAVLANDRKKVADMTAFPLKDFSEAAQPRGANNRAQFLARYDDIFTAKVIAGIRANRIRAFKPGSDDGEAPGPIQQGEYLLDLPEPTDQIVFAPKGNSYAMTRFPFYS